MFSHKLFSVVHASGVLISGKRNSLGLDSVFKAIVLNKILYALPVYFGYLTEGRKDMFRRVFKKADRMGFTFCAHELDLLNDTAQYKLFRRSLAEQHCLHHLFPVKPWPPGTMNSDNVGTILSSQTLNINLTSIIYCSFVILLRLTDCVACPCIYHLIL